MAKQKIKFLATIWGRRYIKEFSEVSLPSYLAPGNIPALAKGADLEVLLMTTEDSLLELNESRPFRHLQEICPVRFILIDDLIASGAYGVTLTLAYARAIRSVGTEQTDTYFVFMNSDFVLADGSLASLPTLMEQTPCIMAASLRGQAEAILPILRQKVCTQSHQLAIPPREMVAVTLKYLHPTVLGKRVDLDTPSCDTNNQLYWRVNDETLLGRSYLIFMLAIKPEVPMGPVNSYCDYGFVPELVPSGRIHVIEDSDQFFMLEMQPVAQEREMMRLAQKSRRAIAKELDGWTTREHRITAQHDTIFHSGDLPLELDKARQQAREMVDDLERHMGPAKNHVDHYYWRMGVLAWWARRKVGNGHSVPFPVALERALNIRKKSPAAPLPHAFPEELLYPRSPERIWRRLHTYYFGLLANLRARQGMFPNVPFWHPRWSDAQLLMGWGTDALCSSKDALIVDLGNGQIAKAFEQADKVRTVTVSDLSAPVRSSLAWETTPELLICLPVSGNIDDLDGRLATKQRLHEVAEMISQVSGNEHVNSLSLLLYYELNSMTSISAISSIFKNFIFNLPASSRRWRLKVVGGRWRGIALDWELRLRKWSMAFGGRRLPIALVTASVWLIFCALIAVMNKLNHSGGGRNAEARSTSILFTLERRT